MYVNPIVPNFFYYGGNAPWTNDVLSQFAMPVACCVVLPTPRTMGAYVDAPTPASPFTPLCNFQTAKASMPDRRYSSPPLLHIPGVRERVLEFDAFILVGPGKRKAAPQSTRSTANNRPRAHCHPTDTSTSANGDTLTGSASGSGWAWALLVCRVSMCLLTR